ncbi:MAG: ABC transporter ATP-binding protein [Verrucomicrobia bacterium]|nr:ABC transporter ATP-binding protein [Verrucomicrobiota bacterium]
MSNPVLHARGVHKAFVSGDGQIQVLRGLDLAVGAGETVSIRGESGSGKSTLLNLLAGLDSADAGTIEWSGSADTSARRRARYLGIVFQSFYLIPELDALQNVVMAARIAGVAAAPATRRARELLARVGLAGRVDHLPSHLSGGERQRVAVARALMNSPRLLLADEPTGNLDEQTGTAIIDLLLGVCAETQTALVLVTHNAAHATRCGRALTLHHGQLG